MSLYALQLIKYQLVLNENEKNTNDTRVCSGTFSSIYKLPCRHQMKLEDPEYAVPIKLIGERWLLYSSDQKKNSNNASSFSVDNQENSVSVEAEWTTKASNTSTEKTALEDQQRPMLQSIRQKLDTILYKLESAIDNEPLESNQLQYINALENVYTTIMNKSSESHVMPTQKHQSQPSSQSKWIQLTA